MANIDDFVTIETERYPEVEIFEEFYPEDDRDLKFIKNKSSGHNVCASIKSGPNFTGEELLPNILNKMHCTMSSLLKVKSKKEDFYGAVSSFEGTYNSKSITILVEYEYIYDRFTPCNLYFYNFSSDEVRSLIEESI